MTRDEHLMVIAMEECDEVSQRISKALRFGMDEVQPGQKLTNRQRIINELNDLAAALGLLDLFELDYRKVNLKRAKVAEFLAYSEECGTLTNIDEPAQQD